MVFPEKMRFRLVNSLSESDVEKAKFVVYAHSCSYGIYVGMSSDPVKRWKEHVHDAKNLSSHNSDDNFREAIRKCGERFEHYILAVSSNENIARSKEAAAIKYYSKNLNMKNERISEVKDFGFRGLSSQIPKVVFLKQKSQPKEQTGRSDRERRTIIAEVYMDSGRKRLRCTDGQPFRKGLRVECSREERERFNPGDKVRVRVALSEKRGQQYLVAAKTSKLLPVYA